jgi:hypothetical protein
MKQELLKKNKKKLICSFSLTFNQIDDVRSLNNSKFGDCIYPIQLLKKKYTINTARSASCLELHWKLKWSDYLSSSPNFSPFLVGMCCSIFCVQVLWIIVRL